MHTHIKRETFCIDKHYMLIKFMKAVLRYTQKTTNPYEICVDTALYEVSRVNLLIWEIHLQYKNADVQRR